MASLMFFVSDELPPAEVATPQLAFCGPPRRARLPPPLPPQPECAVDVSTPALHGVLTLKPQGDEWIVTLDTAPMTDVPARQLRGDGELTGSVNDLRWHEKAGVPKATHRTWKQKPGRA